jgi:hypothetical protein
MENLQIIAKSLGLIITKVSSGYLLNNGGYSMGMQFDNLESLAKELSRKIKDLKG